MLQECCFATTNKPKEAASSCRASTIYGLNSSPYNLLTHPFHFRCRKWQFPSINQLNVEACSIIFVCTLGQDLWLFDAFSEFHGSFEPPNFKDQSSKTWSTILPFFCPCVRASGLITWPRPMDAERWIGSSCCARDMHCLLDDDDTVQRGRVKQHETDFKFHLWFRILINVMAFSPEASPVHLHFAFSQSDSPFHKGPRLLCVWFHPVQHQNKWYKLIHFIDWVIMIWYDLQSSWRASYKLCRHLMHTIFGPARNHNSGRVTANVRSTGRASKCGKKNSMSPVSTHWA